MSVPNYLGDRPKYLRLTCLPDLRMLSLARLLDPSRLDGMTTKTKARESRPKCLGLVTIPDLHA
jgi:hypothetical protein